MKNIVIIGNGISGITLARHIRKMSNHKITVIGSESEYFFSRTALMYVYMGHMPFENTQPYENWFWKKNNIDLVFDHVNTIDFNSTTLHFNSGKKLNYDELILALGSKPNFFSWKGRDLQGVQGLFSKQDLEAMEKNTKEINKAIVVGGGLIGVEMVEMLRSRNIEVKYLVREFKFWSKVLPSEEGDMIEKHICEHGVELLLNEEIDEFIGENNKIKSVRTKSGKNLECEFAGVCIGVSPNVDFLRDTKLKINKGIVVNEYFETNIPSVFAIGDCAEFENPKKGRLPIEQIWYTGRMHGETLAKTICGNKTAYTPGNFFNSAKLFDIEYQVYSRDVIMDDHLENFVYINPEEKKSIRIFFDRSTGRFEGVTLLGIRYRHEVCDKWLTENRSVEYVLQHLSDANFDPEFYKHFEAKIIEIYNNKYNKNIQLKPKSWKRILGISE